MRARIVTIATIAAVTAILAGCAGEESGEPDDTSGGSTVGQVLDETSPDGRQLRELPADNAPEVRIEVTEDPDAGWNVHLDTERFTFAPQRAGEEARPSEGHAHLYLDGEKIARVYGPWYHIPPDAVSEGEHTLSVELNANDHTAWAVDGQPVSDSVEIISSGNEESGHSHGDSPSPSASPADTADVNVDIEIAGEEVSPPPGRTEVELGQTVRITVTSDEADELHLHGYDLSAAVGPDEEGVLEFTADQSGIFELETHDSGLVLTQLVVQ